jgi:hypothetical protein
LDAMRRDGLTNARASRQLEAGGRELQDSQRPLKSNLQLDEAVVGLAERTAARYGITVQELIETLLLECRERDPEPEPAPAPVRVRRGRGRVLDMAEARRRRAEAAGA